MKKNQNAPRLKKNQNAARPSERPPVREEKMSNGHSERPPVRGEKMPNDISTDIQYNETINRSSGLQYSSESYGGKQKHVESDGHLNKHFGGGGEWCLKKIQNAPRPSNDISTDVQYIKTINRSSGLRITQ